MARLAEVAEKPIRIPPKKEYTYKPPNNTYIAMGGRFNTPTPLVLTGELGNNFVAEVYEETEDFFENPLPSREILNFKLGNCNNQTFTEVELDSLELIRAVKIPCYNNFFVMPLLHDNN